MFKKNFLAVEELNDGTIQYSYQFIDKQTKQELYYQDFHSSGQQKVSLNQTITLRTKKDGPVEVVQGVESSNKNYNYIVIAPKEDEYEGQFDNLDLTGIGKFCAIYVKQMSGVDTKVDVGFVVDRNEFKTQHIFGETKIYVNLTW